jgi:hypothetical protein
MNVLNNGVVQNNWKGACSGRSGNVRFVSTASKHTCEDTVLNRWHCTLSRLEYTLRNKKIHDYVAPDAVDYPQLANQIISKLIQESQQSDLPQPQSTLDGLLLIEDLSHHYHTVRVYISALLNTTTPDMTPPHMDIIELTKALLANCTTEQKKVLRTRLVRWGKRVFELNPNARHKIDKWNQDKDINMAILNLVFALDRKEKAP